jgi:hypothetical protein
MENVFHSRSTFTNLLFNRKLTHILNPWHIIVDTNQETITIRKRNPFLIGFDEQIVSFRYIRSIIIDEHLFGADIHIKVMGGRASVYCISKRDAKTIKNILLEYNSTKKGKGIIFS